MQKPPIKIRLSTINDESFILRSWIRGYSQSAYAVAMDKEEYYERFTPHAQSILRQSKAVVAVSPDDNDQILGFAVFETTPTSMVLHYIYTKQAFRRLGIAKMLAEYAEGTATISKRFSTAYAKSLAHWPFKYNPIFFIKKDFYDSSRLDESR